MRASARLTAFAVAVLFLSGCALFMQRATIAYIAVTSHLEPKRVEIEIHKSFIKRIQNRVTIDTTFTMDKVMKSPLPASLDGDLHFSGRAPEVGLPVVGEIVNASTRKDAIDLAHRIAAVGEPVRISGVWRIWPEHAGKGEEEQGEPLEPFDTVNPDHVFEIHPVTRIAGLPMLDTYKPVDGFKPGPPKRSFEAYENAKCDIRIKPETVSIVSETGLYNDVEFLMEVSDDVQVVAPGGRFVMASALDLNGTLLVKRLRIVFTAGTAPEQAVRGLKRGDRLHAYGIPRVDLSEVSRRVAGAATDPSVLTGSLPYEVIIIGVYGTGK
jgi:hypothetical protein